MKRKLVFLGVIIITLIVFFVWEYKPQVDQKIITARPTKDIIEKGEKITKDWLEGARFVANKSENLEAKFMVQVLENHCLSLPVANIKSNDVNKIAAFTIHPPLLMKIHGGLL